MPAVPTMMGSRSRGMGASPACPYLHLSVSGPRWRGETRPRVHETRGRTEVLACEASRLASDTLVGGGEIGGWTLQLQVQGYGVTLSDRVAWPLRLPDWHVTATGQLPVGVAWGTFHDQLTLPFAFAYREPRPAAWLRTPS